LQKFPAAFTPKLWKNPVHHWSNNSRGSGALISENNIGRKMLIFFTGCMFFQKGREKLQSMLPKFPV
jgi:hypothetical protein